jgi:dihydropteroate synthase-like protein
VRRAHQYKLDGADVIDIGCLPETPFPHLEEVVRTLKSEGYTVSVDSLAAQELLRGGEAGADFIFSLTEDSAWIADRIASIPVLISRQPSDEQSLYRLVERFTERGGAFYADAILDPIHYGFSASIVRYTRLRERFPTISIMMGIGNLSELTHTDSLGLNTLLMGIASELGVQAVLTTQVSLHCRTAVREIDLARRVLFAARADNVPPRHISEGLMALHERHPFPYSDEEIRELAGSIRDPNFRIQVSAAGIHIYNRDGLHSATDPYDLFPLLNVGDDGAHAFYLGMELARAQIAWRLGKRYEQDEALQWGCVVERQEPDKTRSSEARTTLKARRYGRRESGDAPTPIPSNNHTSDDQ